MHDFWWFRLALGSAVRCRGRAWCDAEGAVLVDFIAEVGDFGPHVREGLVEAIYLSMGHLNGHLRVYVVGHDGVVIN